MPDGGATTAARLSGTPARSRSSCPGITDTTTLAGGSACSCGQAQWQTRGPDRERDRAHYDIATPDMIRQLPAGFALLIRGGNAPVIARLPRAWNNLAYRHARRRGAIPALRHPLSPEPDSSPGLYLNTDDTRDADGRFGPDAPVNTHGGRPRSQPEPGAFPDSLPAGWSTGDRRLLIPVELTMALIPSPRR